MDEKLREKIENVEGICASCPYNPCPINSKTKVLCPYEIDQILALIKEAGYRQVIGEPPVLSDIEVRELNISQYLSPDKLSFRTLGFANAVAKAQVDKIKKWLNGEGG